MHTVFVNVVVASLAHQCARSFWKRSIVLTKLCFNQIFNLEEVIGAGRATSIFSQNSFTLSIFSRDGAMNVSFAIMFSIKVVDSEHIVVNILSPIGELYKALPKCLVYNLSLKALSLFEIHHTHH